MNVLNRMMSYDKNQCDCENCKPIIKQTVKYPPLTEEEIEQIIKERYDYKDGKTKTFIRKALRKHGDKYDYSNVIYINNKTKVEIICRVEGHESFQQTPHAHLNGQGCPICGGSKKLTTREFIERANEVHGEGTYDYSKTEYINAYTKVTIICPKHGEFTQTPISHLMSRGCSICGIKKLSESKKSTTKKFIEKSNEVHGEGTYDYSKVEYVNNSTEVIIICPKHGEFTQTPSNHLQGKCCPKCAIEKQVKNQKSNTKEFIKKANEVQGI